MHQDRAWGSHKSFGLMPDTAERLQKNMHDALDRFFADLSADGATPASTLKAYRTDLTQCMTFLADRGITAYQAPANSECIQPERGVRHQHAVEAYAYPDATDRRGCGDRSPLPGILAFAAPAEFALRRPSK